MRQEYGYFLSVGWKLVICLLAAAMISLGVWFTFLPFMEDSIEWWFFVIAWSMGLAMVALTTYALIDTFKSKLILLEDRIQKIDVFNVKELKMEEIKGYKRSQRGIHIVPMDPGLPTIGISLFYKKADELESWLERHYPDLDELAIKNEEQEILLKKEFGRNVEERNQNLQRAKKLAKFLNIFALVVGLWILFYPFPYFISTGIAIMFPLLVVIALNKYKGLIRIDEKKGTVQSSLLVAIVTPSAGLVARALMDFSILDYQNLWLPMGTGSVILLAMLIQSSNEFNFRKGSNVLSVLALGLFVVASVFGSITIVNCIYDSSAPKIYQAKIVSKRISSGKSTEYYLELSPWGSRQETEDVSVNTSLYEKMKVGEMVDVNVKEGLVGIPWYFVREP